MQSLEAMLVWLNRTTHSQKDNLKGGTLGDILNMSVLEHHITTYYNNNFVQCLLVH